LNVAVIGAGIGGMAASIFLARAGHRVTLFERFPEPKPVGAGLLLQPTGLAVLERLGLLDTVLASGARVDRLFGTIPGGRTILDRAAEKGRNPLDARPALTRADLPGLVWQAVRWLAGRSPFAEVRERATRQLQFALLRPGRIGG